MRVALLAVCVLPCLTAAAAPTDSVRAGSGRPIARIKDNVICCPREDVHLDGWASIDVGGEVVEWQWDFNEDGRTDTVSTTGEMVIRAPRRSQTYSVILHVKDNEGNLSEPDTVTVYVMDIGPTVSMRSDTTIKVGVRVAFRPVVHWVCGQPVRYEWDFNDDGKPEYHSGTDGNTTREYYTPGRYVARFRVVDTYNREAGATTVVTVLGRHGERVEEAADSLTTSSGEL
jgi:hypothetical protein